MGLQMSVILAYLDTTIWNVLCDQAVEASKLTNDLAAQSAQLVLGTNAVYELAKTFRGSRTAAPQRAVKLFSFLKPYVQLGIPLLRQTDDLLREEAKHAAKEIRYVELFYGSEDYKKLVAETEKLAQGNFDSRAAQFMPLREAEAKQSRYDLAAHIEGQPDLIRKLKAIPDSEVARWIEREVKGRGARRILAAHLAQVIKGPPLRDLTWLAKQLLASQRFKVSHALVRSDLYLNWRYCQVGTLGKDSIDDNYHGVNAGYCDLFVTADPGLAAYMSHVLTRTRVGLYDRTVPVGKWLVAICGHS